MALKQAGLIFRAEAAGSLVVTPRAGESLLVKAIALTNQGVATLQQATIINDTARVGFFRSGGLGGKHLAGPNDAARGLNLLDAMRRWFGFKGYPVVQGESLTVSLDTSTADILVVADLYEQTDLKSTDQCGSKSNDLLYVNYGTNLSAVAATGYNKLDNRRNPAEMPGFPFGAPGAGLVPAGRKCHIYMMGGQAMGRFTSGGNTASTAYVRLRVGQNPAGTIIDRNDVGYPYFGTTPGAATDYTSSRQAFVSAGDNSGFQTFELEDLLVPQMDFVGNDELAVQVQSVIVGTGTIAAGDIDIWTVQRIYQA